MTKVMLFNGPIAAAAKTYPTNGCTSIKKHPISRITEQSFDLVVTDEHLGDMTGLEFIEKMISKRPMVNCAAITSLLPADFHEASEGLGILMPLPVMPVPLNDVLSSRSVSSRSLGWPPNPSPEKD